MNIKILFVTTIVLLLPITVLPKGAIAREFSNKTVGCYFFKGEKLALQETCKSDGASWMGGGGHSLKWSDGIVTQIKFGLHGRGTPICPSKTQNSVDDTCGEIYSRSMKTLKRVDEGSKNSITCVQLDRKSVCWGGWRD